MIVGWESRKYNSVVADGKKEDWSEASIGECRRTRERCEIHLLNTIRWISFLFVSINRRGDNLLKKQISSEYKQLPINWQQLFQNMA